MAAGQSENGVLLALDQGTTSSRTMAIDLSGQVIASAQEQLPQHYPQAGWVEHNPEDIWGGQLRTAQTVVSQLEGRSIIAIGVSNQRETTIIWDKSTGKPIHNAIVWQDRRTANTTQALMEVGHGDQVTNKTGLVLDPYFSATKIAWILDNTPGARERAERGELAFGTVESFLINRLTDGASHVTDATNAARTSLLNIEANCWDEELCRLFNVPMAILPEVRDCAGDFGVTDLFGGSIPIHGAAGDQQAAAIGQACFHKGDVKSTYGTGAFLILNTGTQRAHSTRQLLSTIAYRLNGEASYALEGSILAAGTTIQWLRDELGVIRDGAEAGELAESLTSTDGVYLVPAFAGLGAPHWDPDARGAIVGLTRGTGRAHVARAGLEAAAYQTHELFRAMAEDGVTPARLKVDGGMAVNNWLMQFLSDILDVTVARPKNTETTALGASILAALGAGEFSSLEEAASLWQLDREFKPQMDLQVRRGLLRGWNEAINRTLSN